MRMCLRRLLGVWKDWSHCRHGYRFSVCRRSQKATHQDCKRVLGASFFSDDRGRKENAPKTSIICGTHAAQSTRTLSEGSGTSGRAVQSPGGTVALGRTYPTVALFHVGHVALPIRNPLLALLAGPAGAPQPGLGLSPAMGLRPAPAARGQGAAPSSHTSGWGLSGNSRARAAGGRVH